MTGRGIESKKLYIRFWNLFFSIPSDNLPAYSLKLPVKHNSVYSLISAFCHLWTALIDLAPFILVLMSIKSKYIY